MPELSRSKSTRRSSVFLQRLGVVVADRRERAGRLERRRRHARREEAGDAEQHRDRRVGLVDGVAGSRRSPRSAAAGVGSANGNDDTRFPELAQPLDPALGRVAGDQRRVDRADRDAGDPVAAHGASPPAPRTRRPGRRRARRRPAARGCIPRSSSRRGAARRRAGFAARRAVPCSMAPAVVGAVEAAQQAGPDQGAGAGAARRRARLLGGAGDDVPDATSIRSPSASVPPACARSWTAQVASKRYIAWKASATVLPTVSRPWLRSIRKVLSPRSATRRGFSSSRSATPS